MSKDIKQNFNDEISLKELLEKGKEWYTFLLSKWKIILFAAAIGSVLGVTYSLIKKPVYTATLTFVVEDDKSGGGLGSALGLASSLGVNLGGGGGSVFSGSNLMELFKSRAMVEKTLLSNVVVNGKEISLAEMYIQDQGWREKWNKNAQLSKISFQRKNNKEQFSRVQDSIFGEIFNNLSKNSLNVEQKDIKVSIINIDVSSTNELFSKMFTEGLVKQVSNFYIDTKSKKSRENMLILEHQTDSIRRALNGAITGVAVANDNTFNLNPALNVKRVPSARRQVDVQANTAILTELVKQTELAKVTLRKDTPLIQVIDKPILPLPKEKFGIVKGVLLGGMFFGFLTVLTLVIKQFLKQLQ
ncbi:Wzz/FepE/Etk N-terminal domain-containing protein [Flavobacterium crassostreae]|uniref:Lipopolysaccharide biosynthesis protein n=1 Tax=Flavobacterium crassostreae TaxID=1763534 RepID=A0A1B9E3Q0_9FLAO|nr:Wzz/FepE/Etk N-terminal domain-containing protein [Flavobacterium crassostreae]OCB76573.1 lipopolysaccharide biosynthesis protein [Flavobacterium crassostreae]